MDTNQDIGLEFLDLTDVDEYERNRVLSSLQPLQHNVKFPWFIGDEKINNEGIKSRKPSLHTFIPPATKNSRTPLTIINPENGLVIPLNNQAETINNPAPVLGNPILSNPENAQATNQYYNSVPQYVVTTIPNVSVHIPHTNYGNYAPNTSHTDIPTNTTIYPPYMHPSYPVKTPVYYGVPPAQPMFVSQPPAADAGGYYQSNAAPPFSGPVQNENIAAKTAVSPLSADTPAFTPKNPQNFPVEIQDSPPEENVPEPQIVVEKSDGADVAPISTTKSTGVWGSGKSWASLFTPKEGAAGTPQMNGVTKPEFAKAVNQESSNDDSSCPIKNPRRNHFIDPDCYRMGEFLAKYSVDGRAISLQPRGLINQSNYCYINSILQALIACPPLYNLLSGLAENISSNAKRKPTPVIDGMCKFVKEYKHLPANMRVNNRRSDGGKKDQKKDQGVMINTDIPFEPSWIYKILHGLQTDLMEGRQEDAEEFLGCLLNHLSDEMLELIKLVKSSSNFQSQVTEDDDDAWQVMGNKNKGSVLRKTEFEKTPITDIFGGSLKSKIHRIGGHITENTQPFLTLPLNIEKVKTVREALEALSTKYQLEGLTSAKTNEEVEAWQQVMLDELPVVLVLHLKCFDFKLDGCTKIVKALEFPIDLKIDAKLLSSSKSTNAKEKQYKLFAVVYHDGKEATKGHYVTDAFHVGYSSWLRYDDASVKPVQEEQVLNPQGTRVPYLLFYRRSDTIRSR